jgi:hypothetical protein
MAGLKLTAFAGIVPRASSTLLKDNEAQIAENAKLYSGELRSWNSPGSLAIPVPVRPGTLSIYKHFTSDGDDLWLSWTADVNVVPGPIFATTEYPIYYTGDGNPKKTNAALASSGAGPYYPGDWLEMGVPNPTTAPTPSNPGGSESRVYLYTFISMFGSIEEESGPSPASGVISVNPGSSVTVSGLPAAAPAGKYNITKIRLYRSVTGSNSTPYLRVADINIGTTTFVDSVTATGLGQVLPSANYSPPPVGMTGLVAMANGILAGFRGNEIFFSEPFKPHAWPAEYALTVEFPVVGLASFGESLVAATKGNPTIITGSTPASMSQAKVPIYEPCVSKRSVAADDTGAMYASPNGIIKISQGFAGNATRGLMTRAEWQHYNPTGMLGTVLDGRYYLFCDLDDEGLKGALILDRNESASPLTITTLHTSAAHVEPLSAALHVVENNEIKIWEGDALNFIPYEWKSKMFILPRPLNFGAAQIEANFDDVALTLALQQQRAQTIAANQAFFNSTSDLRSTISRDNTIGSNVIVGSAMAPLPSVEISGRFIQLRVFCQQKQVAFIEVKDSKPFRLPSGFKGDRWEFSFAGNVPIRHLKVAETSRELMEL